MSRIITVKGVGKVTLRPDYIIIFMNLDAKDVEYTKAMEIASDQLEQVKDSLQSIGFEKEAIKTTNFNVFTEYENIRDENNDYKRIFKGFVCSHQLKVSFEFQMEKLSLVLATISKCVAHPELDITFTVKNPTAVHEELLREVSDNAKKKAKLLCEASGVFIGDLLTIDYNWKDVNIYSNTSYRLQDNLMSDGIWKKVKAMIIEPDDIEVNDSATFVWEIK